MTLQEGKDVGADGHEKLNSEQSPQGPSPRFGYGEEEEHASYRYSRQRGCPECYKTQAEQEFPDIDPGRW